MLNRAGIAFGVIAVAANILLVAALLTVQVPAAGAQALSVIKEATKKSDDKSTETVTLPENLTPDMVRELVSKLDDQQVRELLLQRLDAVDDWDCSY